MVTTDKHTCVTVFEPTNTAEREVFLSASVNSDGARITMKGRSAMTPSPVVVTLNLATAAHADTLEQLARSIRLRLVEREAQQQVAS